jgi:predicted nucleotidyltransferase
MELELSKLDHLKAMVRDVAIALGEDILKEVAFLGGCATALHITDAMTKEAVRFTEDVDLVINVVGYVGWNNLRERLLEKGFKTDSSPQAHTCSMVLGSQQVDFIPDDEDALGHTCQWYKEGLINSIDYDLGDGVIIQILSPPYFIASKIVAYQNRGNGDMLESKDMEDIFNVIDGREELIEEIKNSPDDLRSFIAESFIELKEEYYFDSAIQSTSNNDKGREELIFDRVRMIIEAGS